MGTARNPSDKKSLLSPWTQKIKSSFICTTSYFESYFTHLFLVIRRPAILPSIWWFVNSWESVNNWNYVWIVGECGVSHLQAVDLQGRFPQLLQGLGGAGWTHVWQSVMLCLPARFTYKVASAWSGIWTHVFQVFNIFIKGKHVWDEFIWLGKLSKFIISFCIT